MDSFFQTQSPMDLDYNGSTPSLASMVGPTNGFPPMANHSSQQGGNMITVSGGLGIHNGHGQFEYAAAVETQVELDSNGSAKDKCVRETLGAEDDGKTKMAESFQNQNHLFSPPKGRVQIAVNSNGVSEGYGLSGSGCGHMSYDPTFQIFVKNMDGKSMTFEVKGSDTVHSLMKKIQDRIGMPPSQQRLTYEGKPLQEQETLKSCKIHEGVTVHLNGRLRGGNGK